MNYEVEVKYPLGDEIEFRQLLKQLGGQFVELIQQEDDYLAHPVRDFAATDEAFRVRRVGPQNCITYKGPLIDKNTKTREEIEITCSPGGQSAEQLLTIFERLGFGTVHRVCKSREVYTLRTPQRIFEVVIDDVAGLGRYVELECTADESGKDAARQQILDLAARLNLGPEVERRSYLRLLLETQA